MVTQAKHGSVLRKKLFRDVLTGWKSFAAVLIICMLSVTLYCGIDSCVQGIERNLDMQFSATNLADIWVSGELSDRKAAEIAALPGVSDAQRRVSIRATVQSLPGEPELDLYMSEGPARINRPMLMEGSDFPPEQKNLCIIAEAFAQAHGLSIGDRLTVQYGGTAIELTVHGIGHQSEYIVYTNGKSIKTDALDFGYATVSPGTLAMLPYTETSVTLTPGADSSAVKREIEALIDDAEKKVTLREDDMGVRMAIEEAEQIHALGQVFPVIFFLVAALITWSTMKRLVDNQRQQIGTLRSQGYGRGQLIWHYTSYGLWIALLGCGIGLLLARFVLGRIILDLLRSIYVMPGADTYLDPVISIGISALTVAIAAGASLLSCWWSLREDPAALLRPKSPAKARRVFLERLPVLWRHVSFTNKMVIRNMQRNLTRFLIGLIGVTGCTALLLTGFGLRDSVTYVLDHHYGYAMRYDIVAKLDTPLLQDTYLDALRKRAGADAMESMMEGTVEVLLDNSWQSKSLFVLENEPVMVHLEDERQNAVPLPRQGAVVTEKFIEETGVHPGDTLTIRAQNGKTAEVTVAGSITMQIGQGLYMGRDAWKHLDLHPYSPTSLMLSGASIDTGTLLDMEGVDTVRTLTGERDSNGVATQVMDLVVVVMVVFAGALALVVLYTLGQLSFFERQRDLATLMVLGFYPRENKRVILRENMIIAVLGIPLGLLAGPYLLEWVLHAGLPNTLEFIPHISRISWLLPPVITLLYAQLVNLFIGTKFKSVNMVEALKSVE